MTEYIEREAVKEAIGFVRLHCVAYGENKSLLDVINEIPAVDVVPVRHGRWLTWEEQFPESTPKKKYNLGVFCNKCHNHADNRTDYCPNCGAKMDGGVDNKQP